MLTRLSSACCWRSHCLYIVRPHANVACGAGRRVARCDAGRVQSTKAVASLTNDATRARPSYVSNETWVMSNFVVHGANITSWCHTPADLKKIRSGSIGAALAGTREPQQRCWWVALASAGTRRGCRAATCAPGRWRATASHCSRPRKPVPATVPRLQYQSTPVCAATAGSCAFVLARDYSVGVGRARAAHADGSCGTLF